MNALGSSGGRIPNKVRALWRGQHGESFLPTTANKCTSGQTNTKDAVGGWYNMAEHAWLAYSQAVFAHLSIPQPQGMKRGIFPPHNSDDNAHPQIMAETKEKHSAGRGGV